MDEVGAALAMIPDGWRIIPIALDAVKEARALHCVSGAQHLHVAKASDEIGRMLGD